MPAQLLPEQLPLPLPGHRVALGVEDFLVAPSNRAVIGWIDRWPDWPFAALVVVGPRGSGKSHAAALWQSRSGARTVDLATLDLEAATDLVSSGEPILVDDADRMLAQGGPAELTLLRLYNLARAAGAAIMMTAEAPPASWVVGLADIRSRLNSAMVVEMGSPDDTPARRRRREAVQRSPVVAVRRGDPLSAQPRRAQLRGGCRSRRRARPRGLEGQAGDFHGAGPRRCSPDWLTAVEHWLSRRLLDAFVGQ